MSCFCCPEPSKSRGKTSNCLKIFGALMGIIQNPSNHEKESQIFLWKLLVWNYDFVGDSSVLFFSYIVIDLHLYLIGISFGFHFLSLRHLGLHARFSLDFPC